MLTEQINASRGRIYSSDAVPLWQLASTIAVNHVRQALRFEQVQPVQSEEKGSLPGVAFGRGRIPTADKNLPATIENLIISPSQIQGYTQLDLMMRDLEGHKLGDVVLQVFEKLCDELIPSYKGWLDKYKVELFQTTWIGQLDIDPDDLIDSRTREVLWPVISREKRDPRGRGLTVRITKQLVDPDLLELGLPAPDEEFRLEPRIGRVSSEQIWFSSSSLRSEDHLQLLEALEQAYQEKA